MSRPITELDLVHDVVSRRNDRKHEIFTAAVLRLAFFNQEKSLERGKPAGSPQWLIAPLSHYCSQRGRRDKTS